MANIITPTQFLTPFAKGAIPTAFKSWHILPMAFERKNSQKLNPGETVELYKSWMGGKLELNKIDNTNILLEVKITHAQQDHLYSYPINLNYLFSLQWREDNLSSPFGFFRWSVEMDTALRLGMVKDYEGLRLPQSITSTAFPLIKTLEDKNCGFKYIPLSLPKISMLHTLLVHCQRTNSLKPFIGNNNQAVLAQKIGISNLQHFFSALSKLTDHEGRPWTEILEYMYLDLSFADAKELGETRGIKPSQRNLKNIFYIRVKELITDPAATGILRFRLPANRWPANGSARASIFSHLDYTLVTDSDWLDVEVEKQLITDLDGQEKMIVIAKIFDGDKLKAQRPVILKDEEPAFDRDKAIIMMNKGKILYLVPRGFQKIILNWSKHPHNEVTISRQNIKTLSGKEIAMLTAQKQRLGKKWGKMITEHPVIFKKGEATIDLDQEIVEIEKDIKILQPSLEVFWNQTRSIILGKKNVASAAIYIPSNKRLQRLFPTHHARAHIFHGQIYELATEADWLYIEVRPEASPESKKHRAIVNIYDVFGSLMSLATTYEVVLDKKGRPILGDKLDRATKRGHKVVNRRLLKVTPPLTQAQFRTHIKQYQQGNYRTLDFEQVFDEAIGKAAQYFSRKQKDIYDDLIRITKSALPQAIADYIEERDGVFFDYVIKKIVAKIRSVSRTPIYSSQPSLPLEIYHKQITDTPLLSEQLHKAMESLPPDEKAIIESIYILQEPRESVAKRLRISLEKLNSRVDGILKKLKKELEE